MAIVNSIALRQNKTMEKKIPQVHGFRFTPKDRQLFCHYLYGKIRDTLLPIDREIVRECDLYGADQPWILWESNGGNHLTVKDDLFFFTKLRKKNAHHSKRFLRTIGTPDCMGTWSGEDAGEAFEFQLPNNTSTTVDG